MLVRHKSCFGLGPGARAGDRAGDGYRIRVRIRATFRIRVRIRSVGLGLCVHVRDTVDDEMHKRQG